MGGGKNDIRKRKGAKETGKKKNITLSLLCSDKDVEEHLALTNQHFRSQVNDTVLRGTPPDFFRDFLSPGRKVPSNKKRASSEDSNNNTPNKRHRAEEVVGNPVTPHPPIIA